MAKLSGPEIRSEALEQATRLAIAQGKAHRLSPTVELCLALAREFEIYIRGEDEPV